MLVSGLPVGLCIFSWVVFIVNKKDIISKAKRKCTFTNEMQEKHPCFRKGRNDCKAECLVCKSGTYISVVHKGNGDLNTHLQSEKHRKAVRWAAASTKMTNYFVTAGSKREDEITAAEGTLAFHAVKHHYSFLSMDYTPILFKKIFPDANVAKKFSSGRTRTMGHQKPGKSTGSKPEVVKRPKVANGQAAQRVRSWTVQNEMRGVLGRVSADAARRIFDSSNPREIRA